MTKSDFDDVAREYDAMARDYRASTQLPFRTFVEHYMVFRVAGPLAGKRVLDLACGEGHYSRLLKDWGAAEVLGVDISSEMIKLAEEAEKAAPLGCRYRLGDVATLALGETFDLVVGNYLLNYAADKDQLLALCRAIARHLRPGGRFIGLNFNMTLDPADYGLSRKYGLAISAPENLVEGDAITLHFFNPDGTEVRFDNHYLAPATYQAAFAEAGLRDLSWEGPWISEAGLKAFPEGYWDDYLAAPKGLCLQALK